MENLLTLQELCRKLKVERSWIYARTRNEEIPHLKVGKYLRFEEREVEEWLKRKK